MECPLRSKGWKRDLWEFPVEENVVVVDVGSGQGGGTVTVPYEVQYKNNARRSLSQDSA